MVDAAIVVPKFNGGCLIQLNHVVVEDFHDRESAMLNHASTVCKNKHLEALVQDTIKALSSDAIDSEAFAK